MVSTNKEMYNPDQKNNYISVSLLMADTDAEESYRKSLVNFFKRLGVLEEKYNKDFASMNFHEMKQLLNELMNGAVGYQKNVLSHLTQYVSWAIENNKTKLKTNPLTGLNIEDLSLNISYKNYMLSSWDDLKEQLAKILFPLEEDTIDNQYRAFCMLQFEGLLTDEIINLKSTDINDNCKIVVVGDKKIYLSTETSKVVQYVLQQGVIKSASKGVSVKNYTITKTGYFLENSRPAEEKQDENYRNKFYNSFKVGLSNKLSNANKKINPTNILKSGIFFRIYQQEMAGNGILFDEYFEYKKSNVKTILNPALVNKEAYEEYKIWKSSFYD